MFSSSGTEVGILGNIDLGGASVHVDETLQNVAVGPQLTTVTGKRNVFLGTKAAESATRTNDNVINGWAAGGGAGDSNVVTGSRAGQFLTEGSTYSVIAGALSAFAASTVANSVLIGSRIGGEVMTTILNSTLIGTGVTAGENVADVSVVARDSLIGDGSSTYVERVTAHVANSWISGTDVVALGNGIVTESGKSSVVAVGSNVSAGGNDALLVGSNLSTGTSGSGIQIFGNDTTVQDPHSNVLAIGAGPIDIDRSDVEYIGTGIVYDRTSNTIEMLKGAFKVGGAETNLGDGVLVVDQGVGMTTTNSLNYNATFETGIKLVEGPSDYWTIRMEPGIYDEYDLVFNSNKGARVVFNDDYEPGVTNFTGQHRCLLRPEDSATVRVGQIVCSTGVYAGLDNEDVTVDEAIPIVAVSGSANDSTAFGVVSAVEPEGAHRSVAVGYLKFITSKPTHERRVRVNGAGEGGILVCGEGGDVLNGDLLCTSSFRGLAMRQRDQIVTNATCAKATCDAKFEGADAIMVGCIYKF